MNNDIPTPRTDRMTERWPLGNFYEMRGLALQLERELAQAISRAERAEASFMSGVNLLAKEGIKKQIAYEKRIAELESQLAQHEPPARSSED